MVILSNAPIFRRLLQVRRADEGVTAIEFSLIVPVFLLIIYGIMELGRLLFVYNSLGHAVYEGSRYAIVRGSESAAPATTSQIEAQVQAYATSLDPSLLNVNVTFDPDNSPGSTVVIAAT
ncbi:MAG: TadE/TadG family type IV pilus assembly protein [Alphaproteobacteria bacterium]|jgi:Flp pilus assembly protein TadG